MSDTDSATQAPRSLTRDLRREFARVQAFFPGGDPGQATVRLPELSDGLGRFISDATLTGLREHNEACSCGDGTLANIDLLSYGDVGVILATHGPAFLLGPLQVIYKAVTCVKLSTYCRETLGLRTVPVLWLTNDTAPTPAVRGVKFTNAKDQVVSLMYEPEGVPAAASAGGIPLDEQVDFLLRLLARDTAETSGKRHLVDLLQRTRRSSASLGEWCARLLHALFHIYGLVVVADDQPYVKRQAAECLRELLVTPGRPARLVLESGAAMEEQGYGSARFMSEGAVPLSFRDRDGFEHFAAAQGDECVSSRGRRLSPEKLIEEVTEGFDGIFIADWFRPVLQASWLPVLAVIADPPETRLLGQLGGLYGAAHLQAPLVFPRMRVVLIERHIAQLLDRYEIQLKDFAQSPKALTDTALAKPVHRPAIGACDQKLDLVQSILDDLRREVSLSNPEYVSDVDTLKRLVGEHLESLRLNLLEEKTESPRVVMGHVERARAHLFPEGKPQERLLNIFPFLFTHGLQLISRLSVELDLFNFEVQTLRL